jgi:hypothetical protein
MPTLPDGPWTVASGDDNGKPLFVRVNTGAAAVAKEPTLPARVGIAVPLRAPDESGLPTADESDVLAQVEAALEGALRVGHEAILVIVLTTGGMREFVLYTAAPQNVEAAVASIRAQFPDYEIQFYVQPDVEWDGYAAFADGL